MADPEVPSALVRKTIDEFGSIDVLVNNAGVIRRAPAAEYSQTFWDEIIAVNLSSVLLSGPVTTFTGTSCWRTAAGWPAKQPE
jgi:NAD(P)-dependent dehydrogenase (short-subunit alcohol dehydrogenase family)